MNLKRLDQSSSVSEDNTTESIQEFYMDFFLALFSVVGDSLYMKGNMLLGNLLPDMARSTKDLDMSLVNAELYSSHIVPTIKSFIETTMPSANYIITELTATHSGGVKVFNSDGTVKYAVDISLSKTQMLGVRYYNIRGYTIQGSSVERIIADKCIATLSRVRFRRVKDFYDLYIILKSKLDFDIEEVYRLILARIGQVEFDSLLSNYPFTEEVMIKIAHAWDKLSLTSFNNSLLSIDKPDLLSVIAAIGSVYNRLKIVGGRL